MNRDLLKQSYLKSVKEEKRENFNDYEAHHLASLIPELMDDPENCIMLQGTNEDLIENIDYQSWAKQYFHIDDIAKTSDMKIIKEHLSPLKKKLKSISKSRNFNEIIGSIVSDK